jgi:hypothetical protein
MTINLLNFVLIVPICSQDNMINMRRIFQSVLVINQPKKDYDKH